MLATIGIQPAEVSRIINLAKNSIHEKDPTVNNNFMQESVEYVYSYSSEKGEKILYDITKIEDVTNDIIAQYGNNPQGEFVGTSSTNSISDNEQTVNNNSMQERRRKNTV